MTKAEQYRTPIPPEQMTAAETDTLWRRRAHLYGEERTPENVAEERAVSRELKRRGWDVVSLPDDEPSEEVAS